MTGRLVVIHTSPRMPAGVLTVEAWRAVDVADEVLSRDQSNPLALALRSAGYRVDTAPSPSVDELVRRAAGGTVVWLADGDHDDELLTDLATSVVQRAEAAAPGPQVEVLVGSYDPPGARLLDLVTVMDRLRAECPWDQRQTHESLMRYLVEETYETVEAVENGDRDHLREELGDILLQVMFHSRIAEEDPAEPWSIDDVAADIVDKLVRRHPHVFAETEVSGAEEVEVNWESIKAEEKGRSSVTEGIPLGLPALALASKVVARAMTSSIPLTVPAPDAGWSPESLGDVLFALVAAAQAGGVDPEQALRQRVRQEIAALEATETAAEPAERGLPDDLR